MYCVRVSLRTIKIFIAQHEKGVVGSLYIHISAADLSCESGIVSARIRIIFADPIPGPSDPDPPPFQPKIKLNYTFFHKIGIYSSKC
jgi:hypothetical protein